MTIEEAKAEALKVLQECCPYPDGTAYIELWQTTDYGVRVAECGWTTAHGGLVFMASDNDGIGICARLERLLIELLEDEDEDEIIFQAELLRLMIR